MAHDCLHPVLSKTHSASPILPIKPVSSYHHRKLQELRKRRLELKDRDWSFQQEISVEQRGSASLLKQDVAATDGSHDMLQGSSNSRGRFTAASRAGAFHSLELPNQQTVMLERLGRREVPKLMAPHCNSPNRECFKEKLSIDKTNPLQQAALECDSKGLDRYDVTPTAEIQEASQSSRRKRQKLHWGLDTKERWERKGNM
ncbi:hypothetical protein BDL97_08G077700 [Sphagnum fallax]|nr:hypothetical protein BDL97_08G077700 [Sphagnum fallax]